MYCVATFQKNSTPIFTLLLLIFYFLLLKIMLLLSNILQTIRNEYQVSDILEYEVHWYENPEEVVDEKTKWARENGSPSTKVCLIVSWTR